MSKFFYTKQDIIQSLQKAGLNKGDTAFFSTSLGMVGIVKDVQTEDELNQLFLDAIKEVLGPNGTILVPTYSYTFGKSKPDKPAVYDPQKTAAEIGPFPNYFLKQKAVVRSLDPMMSMAGMGPEAESLFENLPPTSYGQGSVFSRLVDLPNSKCVSIGLGPNWTPFIHYADWVSKVPFRYDKVFFGGIKHLSGQIKYKHWLYSVRARINESWADAHALGKKATEAGIWAYQNLGRARVYVCGYKQYFDFTIAEQKQNPWITAKGPVCDVLKKEELRVGLKSQNQCLQKLKQNFPFSVIEYQTGDSFFDWIIPEKNQAMAQYEILEWVIAGQQKESVVLFCYPDLNLSDFENSNLGLALELMQKLAKQNNQKNIFRLAVGCHAFSFAAYLGKTGTNNIKKVYHLMEKDNPVDPLAAGHNPMATKTLKDLPFENVMVDSLSFKREWIHF